MYHPPSKRARLWRRFTVVTIMTIAVICGVIILTALTLGYGFNQKDGRIEQGGILQMSSTPTGATLTVNGKNFSAQTPTKLVDQPGNYTIMMDKSGYRTWQKTVPIQAGNITWVAYPRLIPERLDPQTVVSYPETTSSALASASSRRYAVLSAEDTPMVSVAKLDSDDVTTNEYTLPQNFYTAPTTEQPGSRFEIKSWTGDEKKLLLKHTYATNNRVEWIVFNLERPEESVNINRMFDISGSLTKPVFSEGNGSVLYAIVDGSIRVLDLGGETISKSLVDDAVDFRLYGDEVVLYVQKPLNNTQRVGYTKKSYKQPRVIKTVEYMGIGNAGFDMGKYYDKYYFLISHGNRATLFSSTNLPNDSTSELSLKPVKTLELTNAIKDVNMTDNGQFATIQDGTSLSSYNLEIMQSTTAKLTHGTSPLPQTLKYLDGYTLWGMHDGKLRTYEFDGANQQDVMPLVPELGATLSPSGKYLYGFTKTKDNTIALTRVQLLDIKID